MSQDSEFEKALKKFFLDRVIVNPDTKSMIRQHFLEVRDQIRQEKLKQFSLEDWLNLFGKSERTLPIDVRRAIEAYNKFKKC